MLSAIDVLGDFFVQDSFQNARNYFVQFVAFVIHFVKRINRYFVG